MRGQPTRALPILILQDGGREFVFPSLVHGLGRFPVKQFVSGPTAKLSGIQRERFSAWLRLRSVLNGKAATRQDRRSAWENILPAISAFRKAQAAPEADRKKFTEYALLCSGPYDAADELYDCVNEVSSEREREMVKNADAALKARKGSKFYIPVKDRAQAEKLLQKFMERLGEEKWSSENPERAYEYLTARVLRLAALVEWRGTPAIVCVRDTFLTGLEVAHYVSALVGDRIAACLRCGKTFAPKRSDAQFCGDTCRWAKQKANQRSGIKARVS